MDKSTNFPLLIKQIDNYQSKAPAGSPEELAAARLALSTMTSILFGDKAMFPCHTGHILIPDGH